MFKGWLAKASECVRRIVFAWSCCSTFITLVPANSMPYRYIVVVAGTEEEMRGKGLNFLRWAWVPNRSCGNRHEYFLHIFKRILNESQVSAVWLLLLTLPTRNALKRLYSSVCWVSSSHIWWRKKNFLTFKTITLPVDTWFDGKEAHSDVKKNFWRFRR